MAVVTLLTDFGSRDPYVAVVKGVLLARAPGAVLVDLGHELAPGDFEDAGWMLGAAWRWFPPATVHLAVVDPGVGSARRILAVEAAGSRFVAPDNGLLTPIFGLPDAEVRSVVREDLFLPGPGSTFHGRDRFAPVAAFLAAGGALAGLGPVIGDPVRWQLRPPRAEGAALYGRVAHVDRFGNLITDIPSEWLGKGECRVEVAGEVASRRAEHYEEIPGTEVAVLAGSFGTVELAVRGGGLAGRWGVERGEAVRVVVGMTGRPE